ncbi:MAG: hypothetical protein WKG07_41405 [Hymenobacter sp.]
MVRGYALHAGREISSWFFMSEGDFVISIVSFFTQQPSTEYLELLEPSVVYSIDYQQLDVLYRTFPEFNYVGRVLTERYYVQSERRAYQLRTLPARERYAQLVRDFPKLVQRVPLKHLASHLGISPENPEAGCEPNEIDICQAPINAGRGILWRKYVLLTVNNHRCRMEARLPFATQGIQGLLICLITLLFFVWERKVSRSRAARSQGLVSAGGGHQQRPGVAYWAGRADLE